MPSPLLLLAQVAAILLCARVLGRALGLVGQPKVIGEMLAGILLGPSLLGWLAPDVSTALFPAASLGFLNALSQIGLLFFMFLVGLELDPKLIRGREHVVVIASHASIIAPFLLGALLALFLYPRLSDDDVTFTAFALFMGAALSVTAFPVLARILSERGLTRTRLGAIAIACAAVDDVTAWCILAAVVLIARSADAPVSLPLMIGGSILFVLLMLTVVRRALARLETTYTKWGFLSQDRIAAVVFMVLVSGWITERLGVHAVFGAFLAGAVMPKGESFVRAFRDRFEDVMVVLFLPLFFAFTGLRTSVALISGDLWMYMALVLFVAVAGKVGGSALAARASGMSWRESLALGALMNTRGLMGFVILNVGLDIGVISPALFAMLVLMALATTIMTTPLLKWIYPPRLLVHSERTAPAEMAPVRAAQS
ncbi:MAG TPA: cation:proton antiporter [Gemmatimonadaceae bacterium]|nr:cation:proton antiporter [Gemmatimonadaceae bacterium]